MCSWKPRVWKWRTNGWSWHSTSASVAGTFGAERTMVDVHVDKNGRTTRPKEMQMLKEKNQLRKFGIRWLTRSLHPLTRSVPSTSTTDRIPTKRSTLAWPTIRHPSALCSCWLADGDWNCPSWSSPFTAAKPISTSVHGSRKSFRRGFCEQLKLPVNLHFCCQEKDDICAVCDRQGLGCWQEERTPGWHDTSATRWSLNDRRVSAVAGWWASASLRGVSSRTVTC